MTTFAISSCGSAGTPPVAAQPTPTLSQYDTELLTQLTQAGIQTYETPIRIGKYVFRGAGLNYDRNVLSLGYGGLVIDEWKAADFDPSSGSCRTDPRYTWVCNFLAKTPAGHALYAGASGGLPGYAPDLADVYLELGSTALHVKGAAGQTPSLQDLFTVVDGLAPMTPAKVVALNQEAQDYAQHLQDTVASRIDFKTYLPQKSIQDFSLDRKFLGNPTDPLHPYLYLHFGRVVTANRAFEFTVDEFRDDTPLSSSHCGFHNPDINGPGDHCALLFTTPKGISVYSSSLTMRFDLGPTRVVIWLDMEVYRLTQDDVTQFVDSFVEVPAKDIK